MVPVESGSVSVLGSFVPGASIVKTPVPEAFPVIFTFDICYSYAITQVLPLGTVTDIPVSIVIGPAVNALLLVVIT
jgi:hypothetical protein